MPPSANAFEPRKELLNAEEVAQIIGTTSKAVRVALANQRTHLIPPSFTLGRRRVWLRRSVLAWLSQIARQQPRPFNSQGGPMHIPRIAIGLELVDDEGDEVVVRKINSTNSTVTLQSDRTGAYSMSLRDLRCKLRDGEFAIVEDDQDLDDDEEDEPEEDDDLDEDEDDEPEEDEDPDEDEDDDGPEAGVENLGQEDES
jgi:predicted DNA-binding transcriptional regulator AlpA